MISATYLPENTPRGHFGHITVSDDYQTSTNHQVNTVSNICALAIRAINLIVN